MLIGLIRWFGFISFILIFLRSTSYLMFKFYAFGSISSLDILVAIPLAVSSLMIGIVFLKLIIRDRKLKNK